MSGAQAELAARLKQLHGITSEFHDLLQRESEQLAIWPLPDPWPLHTEKMRITQALESGHSALLSLLARHGVAAADAGALQRAIADLLDAADAARWQDTLALLAECRQRNSANSQIMTRLQQSMRQSLDLLRSALEQGSTYGRQGAHQHDRRRVSLGQA